MVRSRREDGRQVPRWLREGVPGGRGRAFEPEPESLVPAGLSPALGLFSLERPEAQPLGMGGAGGPTPSPEAPQLRVHGEGPQGLQVFRASGGLGGPAGQSSWDPGNSRPASSSAGKQPAFQESAPRWGRGGVWGAKGAQAGSPLQGPPWRLGVEVRMEAWGAGPGDPLQRFGDPWCVRPGRLDPHFPGPPPLRPPSRPGCKQSTASQPRLLPPNPPPPPTSQLGRSRGRPCWAGQCSLRQLPPPASNSPSAAGASDRRRRSSESARTGTARFLLLRPKRWVSCALAPRPTGRGDGGSAGGSGAGPALAQTRSLSRAGRGGL